ncbi:MAG: exodeoxyribonuclease VII large subunit, partial [Pseudomonadota bacterium]
ERVIAARLPHPTRLLETRQQRFDHLASKLSSALAKMAARKRILLTSSASALRPELLKNDVRRARQRFKEVDARTKPAFDRLNKARLNRLHAQAKLLETLSYQATLMRGYALVRSEDGRLIRKAADARAEVHLSLSFADGETVVSTDANSKNAAAERQKASRKSVKQKPSQGTLL